MVVVFDNVGKSFRKNKQNVAALNKISFEIKKGEVFGYVGPNGAGKSTSIKILLNLISDYQGGVSISGVTSRDPRSRLGVAYVPESPSLYEHFTPIEILDLGCKMANKKFDNKSSYYLHWLDRFSVAHAANRKVRELSKGTVQRVALAHALATSPELLVLDEPLSGLDPVGRKDVVDILAEYKQNGGSIFLTSHVLHDVERIADRIALINKGELAAVISHQDLVKESKGNLVVRYFVERGEGFGGKIIRHQEYECTVTQGELPDWISRLNELGGVIITVKPEVSLEKMFFDFLAVK